MLPRMVSKLARISYSVFESIEVVVHDQSARADLVRHELAAPNAIEDRRSPQARPCHHFRDRQTLFANFPTHTRASSHYASECVAYCTRSPASTLHDLNGEHDWGAPESVDSRSHGVHQPYCTRRRSLASAAPSAELENSVTMK